MTLAFERMNSLKNTREFLRRLLDPKATPRVPRNIRIEARYLLKHFPWDMHLERLALECPEILEEYRK